MCDMPKATLIATPPIHARMGFPGRFTGAASKVFRNRPCPSFSRASEDMVDQQMIPSCGIVRT
jgi:hypothetical protein